MRSALQPRPWCANSAFLPAALQATGRLRKNVAYFKVNYGIVAVGTTALVMVRCGHARRRLLALPGHMPLVCERAAFLVRLAVRLPARVVPSLPAVHEPLVADCAGRAGAGVGLLIHCAHDTLCGGRPRAEVRSWGPAVHLSFVWGAPHSKGSPSEDGASAVPPGGSTCSAHPWQQHKSEACSRPGRLVTPSVPVVSKATGVVPPRPRMWLLPAVASTPPSPALPAATARSSWR